MVHPYAILDNVPRETQERLNTFVELLQRWNRSLNLVSRIDLQEGLRSRHLAEAVAVIGHLPSGIDRFIDLGSGGGLPALPIAVITGLEVDLVESDQRKAAFLQTALATLNLRGTVWPQRAESCRAPPAGCITARALAALPDLLRYSYRLLRPDGTALFLKGARAEAEICAARRQWQMQDQLLELPWKGSRILKISRLEPRHDSAQ